jgi:uncharacterized protein
LNIQELAKNFLNDLLSEMKSLNLNIETYWDIDHLCYRVESQDQYLAMKQFLCEKGKLLVESEVNGRLISTFELDKPIQFGSFQINLIELPAPKVGKFKPEGFEHIEIVCDVPFQQIIKQNSHLKFDVSGLTKLFNKELEIKLNSGSIKFHHLSLKSVVALEKNTKVWAALQKTKLLSSLSDYDPLIAGTFPLCLETPESDLDILFWTKNPQEFMNAVEANFGNFNQFHIESLIVDKIPTVLAHFICDGIPFELFAQDIPSIQQKAYQHFLVEEKIIKYGGDRLLSLVRTLRAKGMKTELAIAQALNLHSEPYEELLVLQKTSILDLRDLVRKFF